MTISHKSQEASEFDEGIPEFSNILVHLGPSSLQDFSTSWRFEVRGNGGPAHEGLTGKVW